MKPILCKAGQQLRLQVDDAHPDRDRKSDGWIGDTRHSARPWDLFNKNIGRVETVIAEERYAICKECPFLLPTGNCSKCGCFMSAKVKLPNAECPEHKWGQVRISYKEEDK